MPTDRDPRRARRRANRVDFGLIDLAILIAALAGAMVLIRPYLEDGPIFAKQDGVVGDFKQRTWLGQVYVRADVGFGVGSRVAGPLMLGLLVVALRPPRAGLHRLSRRPGFVACVAAASALAVNALEVAVPPLLRTGPLIFIYRHPYEPAWEARVGPAVIGAWLVLAIGRRWRSERGWIDRSGRLLGIFWIVRMSWPWVDRYLAPLAPASWWNW